MATQRKAAAKGSRKGLTLRQQIAALERKLIEQQEEYETLLYLETMPVYDPLYKYSYQTSSMRIPGDYQTVAAWLRAVMRHMAARHPGHGGAKSNAMIVSIPELHSEASRDYWLWWVAERLRKKARLTKKSVE